PVKQLKVDIRFSQAANQVEFLTVGSGDFGYVLGDDAVQAGSGMLFGAHVGNVAAIEDHLRNGADRGGAGNDQADDQGAVQWYLVKMRQGHQQFIATAGDNQQGRFTQQLGNPLGRCGPDLDMVDDPADFTPVAVQRQAEQLGHPPERRICQDRLIV